MERNNNARIVKKSYFLRNELIRPRVGREMKLVKINGGTKVVKRKLRKFNIDVMREAKNSAHFDNERFIVILIVLTQINPSFSCFTLFQRIFDKLRRQSREISGFFP